MCLRFYFLIHYCITGITFIYVFQAFNYTISTSDTHGSLDSLLLNRQHQPSENANFRVHHDAEQSAELNLMAKDVNTLLKGADEVAYSGLPFSTVHVYGNSAVLVVLLVLVSVFLSLICYRKRSTPPPFTPLLHIGCRSAFWGATVSKTFLLLICGLGHVLLGCPGT